MKATEAKLLDLLKKSPQFIIPIYQRTYSWTEPQCLQLWNDILRTGERDDIPAHFMGSVVYIQQDDYQISSQSPLLVIDGQQRLTTVSLILEALARSLNGSEPFEGFSAKKLRHYYLLNSLEEGDLHFKLILTQNDKESLIALVEQNPLPADASIRIEQNFELFERKIAALSDLTAICKGLAKLMVVDVSLTRGQDNPQLIFESMNSTGKELSQADLIRNFVLMGLEPKHQANLYRHHWRPMEIAFGQEAYGEHFDAFMRHYLTVKTGEIPKKGDVYEAFKEHFRRKEVSAAGVDELVQDIHNYATYYCRMALGKEPHQVLRDAFNDVRELKANVAYPLLLELYHDHEQELISAEEFEHIVRLIESYVFRRAICSIPTNSMNKTFATFHRALKKENYTESVLAHLLLLPSYRRFPSDEEFERELKIKDLYHYPRRSYWLRRLENHDRKERVYVDEFTIEHILPQNPKLSSKWQAALGPNWQQIQQKWLHTLGNLTLTGYNSEYSDRPFDEKRDMEGGFKFSPLQVNQGLGQLETWNEDQIAARADRLAKTALEVWTHPNFDEAILDKYRPKPSVEVSSYTVEDHKQISSGAKMRPLFELLRREILALDENVTEEFMKLYVAYRAETNFVDIIPKANSLRLTLNMKFSELSDPKRLAMDVTGKGRWGNGDVQIDLKAEQDIPYALGLVRQALDLQLETTSD
ncbi:MAG: DUF262 and DUF1524 domain-containing protein [bacterium]|nr:DUF262 and DUF1524 domain-containing protein [bacterium]